MIEKEWLFLRNITFYLFYFFLRDEEREVKYKHRLGNQKAITIIYLFFGRLIYDCLCIRASTKCCLFEESKKHSR